MGNNPLELDDWGYDRPPVAASPSPAEKAWEGLCVQQAQEQGGMTEVEVPPPSFMFLAGYERGVLAVADLLRRLQWIPVSLGDHENQCRICRGFKGSGHKEDCALAVLLGLTDSSR